MVGICTDRKPTHDFPIPVNTKFCSICRRFTAIPMSKCSRQADNRAIGICRLCYGTGGLKSTNWREWAKCYVVHPTITKQFKFVTLTSDDLTGQWRDCSTYSFSSVCSRPEAASDVIFGRGCRAVRCQPVLDFCYPLTS